MAARNSIIHIDFQANAGKANAALQALQQESRKAKDEVTRLRAELQNAKAANLPTDQIQKLEAELKAAESASRQWSQALNNNLKGVRSLDEAIKQFNSGKGSVEGMSAALSKAARNAAVLQKSRETTGSQTWKEMDALIKALDKNILKANNDLKTMTTTLQQGGNVSKSTLTQAKSDLQSLISLEEKGTNEWKRYTAQLSVIEGALKRLTLEEQRMVGQQTLGRAFRGDFKTANAQTLEQTIAKLREYQQVINDPNGSGARHYAAAEAQIQKLQASLDLLKQKTAEASGQAMSFKQAMQVGIAAGGGNFKGTVEQLNLAKKTLEQLSQSAAKGGLAWRRIQDQLSNINLELARTGHISKETQAILNQPKGRSFNELKAAIEQGRAALNNMRQTTEVEKKQFDQLAASVKNADIQMKTLGSSSKGSATAFDKAWSRLKTYVGLYVGAAVAMQKIVATMGDLTELSDKMGEVRKTTGFTADEVGRLTTSLAKLDTRTSITGLTELAAVAGQLGLKTEQDVRGFTEAANMLMVALPEMGKEGATAMLKVALATGEIDKIRQQMQDGLVEGSDAVSVAMTKIGSTIDSLRANSAAAAPAITDFVKRVGAVGAQSGITIDQVAALGSTVDALGMRVEMSATALSRMIPAIKNNAFEIGKTIGISQERIEQMYNEGRAMEVIVMLLDKMRGMSAEDIEGALSMGGMADVLKDLNQQGARAGIVFAGLSQNVDELKRQLDVAKTAYEENIAIQNEYNKMNETTAAKWVRLKNQLEETFVGDQGQRWLGGIIDGFRTLVDMVSYAFNSWIKYLIILYATYKLGIGEAIVVQLPKALAALTATAGRFFGMITAGFKSLLFNLGATNMAVKRGAIEWRKLDAAMKQNMWGAIAAAIAFAVYKLVEWRKAVSNARKEMGRWAQEMFNAEQAVEDNFKAVDTARASIDKTNKKLAEAQAALERAKKAMDGSKESANRLAKAEENVKKAEEDLTVAKNGHRDAIEKINSLYGKYLGFTLSEISSKKELANAQEMVNSKLREEITLKRRDAALGRVEEEVGEGRDTAYGKLSEVVGNIIRKPQTVNLNGKQERQWVTDTKAGQKLLKEVTKIAQTGEGSAEEAFKAAGINLYETRKNGEKRLSAYGSNLLRLVSDYQNAYQSAQKRIQEVSTQFDVEMAVDRQEAQERLGKQYDLADKQYGELEKKHAKAQGKAKRQAAAELLSEMDTIEGIINNAKQHYKLGDEDYKEEEEAYEDFIERTKERYVSLKKQRESLLKEAGSLYQPANGTGGGTSGGGSYTPYGVGTTNPTNYEDMTAELLVQRRKQMNEYVNAIQTDSDIPAMLSKDPALKRAIENGMSSDMRTVIEWYNTERLKIQDELHTRHLTNTGDWMDPSKQKGRKKRLEEEWKYYLDELDAYYTERKTRIQEAGTDEGVTEAEVQNRTLANEMEWRQRRAELQKLYANKSAQVTADEQQAIYDILASRTGDTAKFVRQDIAKTVGFILKIGEKSRVEMDRLMGRLDKGIEQDFLKQQMAVTKQMKAIQDIIDKERPFNGITKNMRENLVTMGILTADMTAERNKLMASGEDMSDFNMRQASEEAKRTAWLLGQAEEAYALTVEEMMRRMADAGMTAWADELRRNPEMQEALLAQLHQTYDKVQEAIKKEASLVKKEMDIWWNDIERGQAQSRKGGFEAMLTSLGLAEDQVKRANALIGAGQASERVADRLAIKQMQVRLTMQETYYAKMRQMWTDRIAALRAQGKELDAQHAEMSRNLALSEEQKKLDEQRVAIANQIEESQNRLYKELREWGELISGSVLSVMEASNAGQGEYYTEQAKKRLTGESTYGRYIVVENAGTADATASYRTLSDEEALRIEQQNAIADAWKKAMDDIAEKMNQTITDQVNAMMQNASIDANTDALGLNTEAIAGLTAAMGGGEGGGYKAANDPKIQALNTYLQGKVNPAGGGEAAEEGDAEGMPKPFWQMTGEDVEQAKVNTETLWQHYTETGTEAMQEMSDGVSAMPNVVQPFNMNEEQLEMAMQGTKEVYDVQVAASNAAAAKMLDNQEKIASTSKTTNEQMTKSNASMFAKMTQAANLYGIAYQAMSNDNLSTAQKFEMIALQAAGSAAISGLQIALTSSTAKTAANMAEGGSKSISEMGPIAGPIIFALLSAMIGGMMGLAASKITKAKAEIASISGAAASAGRLSTGMMTYAEGNVNEFTDPSSLREGRTYNVDAADGRTYRARYMGRNPRTHITNGPEFHLSGERGREMIIDADTTHQIVYNEPAVMQVIKTLSGTRGAYGLRRGRGRGMAAFADGNVADLVEMENGEWAVDNASSAAGMSMEMATSLQASIDRNSEVLERAMAEGFKGVFVINGKGGLVDSYDKGKKEALRHGQKY